MRSSRLQGLTAVSLQADKHRSLVREASASAQQATAPSAITVG